MPERIARSAGHPDVVLAFHDEAVAPIVERWMAELERIPVEPDRLAVLDGWPFCTVRVGEHLELHELVLDADAHAPPRYRQGVDQLAGFALAQHQLLESFGIASAEPPAWLDRIQHCPRATKLGPFLLARDERGWWLRCDRRHCSEPIEGLHLHADAWCEMTVVDLALARPDLVRFLGLPAGCMVRVDFLGQLDVQRASRRDANVAVTDAHLSARFASFEKLLAREGSSEWQRAHGTTIATLDFERDADVLGSDALERYAIVCERHRIGPDAAKQTLEHHASPAARRQRWRWTFRNDLAPEQIDLVESRLASDDAERWKLYNATARELVPLVKRPFALLKELVERMDKSRGA